MRFLPLLGSSLAQWTSNLKGPFSELSWSEFESKVLMDPQDCSATENRASIYLTSDDLPASVDWRDKGVVSAVKNQGMCGSCWTFSSTGALEAHHAIQFGSWRTHELSEQQLLDCAGDFDNHGCDGGLPSHAFEYVHSAGGIATEFTYPYHANTTGACSTESIKMIGAKTSRSFNVTEGDEESIKRILATVGPVSIAFQVVDDFRFYHRGIYASELCHSGPQDVNHAVLVVGYGEEGDVPYWIIKNSWGPEWGEEGYFRMVRNKNMCGVATCASYPVLEKDTDLDEVGFVTA